MLASRVLPRDAYRQALTDLGPLAPGTLRVATPMSHEVAEMFGKVGSTFSVMFKTIAGSDTDAHVRTVTLALDENLYWAVTLNVTTKIGLGAAHHSRNGGASTGLLNEGSDYVARYGKEASWARPYKRPSTKVTVSQAPRARRCSSPVSRCTRRRIILIKKRQLTGE